MGEVIDPDTGLTFNDRDRVEHELPSLLEQIPSGERVKRLRLLGAALRRLCPEAADHLEAFHEADGGLR